MKESSPVFVSYGTAAKLRLDREEALHRRSNMD